MSGKAEYDISTTDIDISNSLLFTTGATVTWYAAAEGGEPISLSAGINGYTLTDKNDSKGVFDVKFLKTFSEASVCRKKDNIKVTSINMAATIDIDRMIEICFAAQFFVYGYMALFLYPYNDYDAAPRMRHTGSKPYLRGRRVLAVVYIFLGIAAGFGLCPASPSNGSAAGGWASPLVPACLTLFFMAHTGLLLGLCDSTATGRKNYLLHLLPLPVLCVLYVVFPAWGEAVAVLQSVHLVALIGWYTPLFYKEYDNLNCCCWDAVNETPDDVAPDYDCLPESMPWIGRRYIGLLVITLLALLAHFLPYGWTAYVMAVLFTGYLFWFFYWVFLRFPRFARALFYYMNEEWGITWRSLNIRGFDKGQPHS